MKTRIIIAAAAMGCFSLAQAQEGKDAVSPVAEPASAKSAYHECLLNAGKETFAVLGLDESQIARVIELQTRYKGELQAADEAKAPKGKHAKKAVVTKDVVAKEPEQPVAVVPPAVTTAPVDKSGIVAEEPMEELRQAEQTDPLVMSTEDPTLTAPLAPETTVQTPGLTMPADPAAGDDLRAILTPEQWNQWHKQCYSDLGETGMIQP